MKYPHIILFLICLGHSFAQDSVDQLDKKYTDQAEEGLIRLHTRHREELVKVQDAAMKLKDLAMANKANAKIKKLDDEIRKLGGTPTEPKNSFARGEDRNAIVSTDAVFLMRKGRTFLRKNPRHLVSSV
jgi:hypothetical protein